ncbi:MAG: pentapeptide repeat-containing protein [Rhodospirillales bacterium]
MNRTRLGSDDAADAAMSAERLRTVLDRHEAWIGSGWELGQRADLHGRDLHACDLQGVVLAEADLHRADLHCADLAQAELDGADLHAADLHRADLRDAVLEWADLHRADLREADLHGADLREADLHGADLHGANLEGANLEHADLRGADLRRVKGLTSVQLAAATCDEMTRLPAGLTAGGDAGTNG